MVHGCTDKTDWHVVGSEVQATTINATKGFLAKIEYGSATLTVSATPNLLLML